MPIETVDVEPVARLAAAAADSLGRMRRDEPRVHCLTNTVAQNLTANVLLAVGASPAMALSLDEVDQLVAGAGALLINLGTLDDARRAAMSRAAKVADDRRIPWVLDPVMVDRSPARLAFARELLTHRPAVVRGNGDEIAALGRDLATVVAETGEVDRVSDAGRLASLRGGHPLMTRVTGLGCALSALVAGFCTVETDPFAAAAQALLVLGVAGEMAAQAAEGPGSFQVALIDRLYTLDAAALEKRGQGA